MTINPLLGMAIRSNRLILRNENFRKLHNQNVYKNFSIQNRYPDPLIKKARLGYRNIPNAWENSNETRNLIARVLARKMYPVQSRANLYLAYLHNLGMRRYRRAPHARKEKNYWEGRLLHTKIFGNSNLPVPEYLKRRNDGTWGYTHSLNKDPGIVASLSNNHLKMYPYLREFILRKNSPKIKGLKNINGYHYVEAKHLKNFSNVREAIKNRRKRQGITAAEAKLKEVFNWARRRTAARNRGQFIGQMLKNQYEGTLFKPNTSPINVMKYSFKQKNKSPSPPKPTGPLMRTESMKQREAQLGLAGAAKHPTGSPNNKRITWSRRANGTINIHKTIENLNMTLTPANLKRIGKMTIPNAQNEIRRLARLK